MPDDQEQNTQPTSPEPQESGSAGLPGGSEDECVFCSVARQELPADIVFHDQDILAFHDIQPKAPVHILVIPRQHITSLADLEKGDQFLVGNMIWVAKYLAESNRIADGGYKIIFNTGVGAGQTIPHLHLHLLGGAKFDGWIV